MEVRRIGSGEAKDLSLEQKVECLLDQKSSTLRNVLDWAFPLVIHSNEMAGVAIIPFVTIAAALER